MNRDAGMPAAVAALPRDERGYPVPFFTGYIDGNPDLRTSDQRKVRMCAQGRLCGVCGTALGYWIAFVTGPVGCENRYTSEPPLHPECARYSLQACPHLSSERAKATADGKIPGTVSPVGGIKGRPDKLGLYLCRTYETVRASATTIGFRLAPAHSIEWWRHGRPVETEEART